MFTKEQLIKLLSDQDNQQDLFKRADAVRRHYVGDAVHLRGLIEFSNRCRNNCLYCGIRWDNQNISRYRLTEEEIIEQAKLAVRLGFKTIVLQSGEDVFYQKDNFSHVIETIKKMDVAITLSVGERTYEEYKAWKEAGADRYLMRIETTDKELYHKLDPGMNWDHRHECLMMIKELGYELGSGIMVGLPGQTIESIANDLLYLKEIGVDMAGIGPFIPHPDTPLKDSAGDNFDLSLRTMALMRLLMPDINIPATTAMETLRPMGRILALKAGANVVMPNMTEQKYRKLYTLYPGKICLNDSPQVCKTCIGFKIESIGRTIGTGYGGHQKTAF